MFCADILGLDMSTRLAHCAFQQAMDGAPLTPDELVLFERYTGRPAPRPGGYPYGVQLTGRQSGKPEMSGARLCYAALGAVLAGQRDVACVGYSQDHRAAQRVLFGYVLRFFEQPWLCGLVVTKTADTIELQGNVRICVLPCRPAAIRGLRCILVVLDELAHYRSSENLPLDKEAWRAALPTLLMTGGKLLALSSPYGAWGCSTTCTRHTTATTRRTCSCGDRRPRCLIRSAHCGGTRSDPDRRSRGRRGGDRRRVPAERVGAARRGDADGRGGRRSGGPAASAGREVSGARRRRDRHARGCQSLGGRRGPSRPRGGRRGRRRAALIRPPFSVTAAAEQTAALCRAYGVSILRGDRFAAGFSDEAFTRAGLELRPAELTTSDAHLSLAAAIGSGRVRLLDHPELLKELRGLERRRGGSKDRVSHRVGAHDDLAAVVSGLVARTPKPTRIGAGFMHIDGL